MTAKQEVRNQDRLRTFIAIGLPEHIVSKLRDVQQDLKACGLRIRWTRPENIHLTLKFLGEIDKSRISAVDEALCRSVKGFQPLALSVKGIGVFPGARRPRVLWAGISGQIDDLRKLQGNLDRYLAEQGFLADTRSFSGHLTLGRFKGRNEPDICIRVMGLFKDMESEMFKADTVTLYQSRLFPSGPVYTKLFTAGLAG